MLKRSLTSQYACTRVIFPLFFKIIFEEDDTLWYRSNPYWVGEKTVLAWFLGAEVSLLLGVRSTPKGEWRRDQALFYFLAMATHESIL